MKSIINGKLYTTENSLFIATWDNGLSNDNPYQVTESLYQSPKGTYFLAGWGGELTEYADTKGETTTSGWAILLVDSDAAADWLATKGFTEEALARFPHHFEEG